MEADEPSKRWIQSRSMGLIRKMVSSKERAPTREDNEKWEKAPEKKDPNLELEQQTEIKKMEEEPSKEKGEISLSNQSRMI